MTPFEWLLVALVGTFGTSVAVFARYYLPHFPDEIDDFSTLPTAVIDHQSAPTSPVVPITAPITIQSMPTDPDSFMYPWDSPQHNWHNTRVLCDRAGLDTAQKNVICACIYQESEFHNNATHHNAHSTDWGLCQINDAIWSGPHHLFADAQDIVAHPERAVGFMISQFKAGHLSLWVSFSSGAYQKWLLPQSPMWLLAHP